MANAIHDVGAFTPGFSSTQEFSKFGSAQGNQLGLSIPQPGPRATLSQWQPNTFDKWKSSGFLGKFIYDIADQAYVAIKSVFWPYGDVNHLNGEYASARDKQIAFAGTASMFIPLGHGSLVAKGIVESAAEHGVIEAGENMAGREGANFTKSTFRNNLIKETGTNPGKLAQAHHIFPQKFESIFNSRGINIHNPKFGSWWESLSHLQNASGYNAKWASFFRNNPNATQVEIINEGRAIMRLYGIHAGF